VKIESKQNVSLCGRDWLGIISLAITVMAGTFAAYSRHDRLLSEVSVSQTLHSERLNRLENKIDMLERDLRIK
tara:strand:+ start:2095 stop:2313 length:219 start_codon:yes stop_codon:yes gene_type:complete